MGQPIKDIRQWREEKAWENVRNTNNPRSLESQ